MITVAALFVLPRGIYADLPRVDPWPEDRDARRYGGPFPVVAHPPCERWGKFATGSPLKKTYTLGDDGGCFEAALRAVQQWGGVLEHPAYTRAWPTFGLPMPLQTGGWVGGFGDAWACHVEQGHYGHPARKPTWLYVVGAKPSDLVWGPAEQRLPEKRLAERGYESARRCGVVANMCSEHRKRTPVEFRDVLISIARESARWDPLS